MQGYKDDGTPVQGPLMDDEGRMVITSTGGAPVYVEAPEELPLKVKAVAKVAQTQNAAWSKGITASSQSALLPEENGEYILIAHDNAAFILTGLTAPTVTTSAAGFSMIVPPGVPIQLRLAGKFIAWIGTAANGFLTVTHLAG